MAFLVDPGYLNSNIFIISMLLYCDHEIRRSYITEFSLLNKNRKRKGRGTLQSESSQFLVQKISTISAEFSSLGIQKKVANFINHRRIGKRYFVSSLIATS
jgi:hypothetical protein